MKKIIFVMLFFCYGRIFALDNILIDGESLSPSFDKNISVYNYFTENKNINVFVDSEENEVISGDGEYDLDSPKNEIIIKSNIYGNYYINVFVNYEKDSERDSYISSLEVEGYNLEFKNDVYEYYLNIGEEDSLVINYELSNDNDNVSISGNGNFNKSDNIISIEFKDIVYKIHVLKSEKVSFNYTEEFKDITDIKKEIVTIVIITISSCLILCFYYIVFKDKTILNI